MPVSGTLNAVSGTLNAVSGTIIPCSCVRLCYLDYKPGEGPNAEPRGRGCSPRGGALPIGTMSAGWGSVISSHFYNPR